MKKEELKNSITLKGDNGADVEYKLQDLDFINVMCDLEDKGIPIYAMAQSGALDGAHAMGMIRTIFSVLIDEPDEKKAGAILSKHIRNGGSVDVVMDTFGAMMGNGGFGNSPESNEEATGAETA